MALRAPGQIAGASLLFSVERQTGLTTENTEKTKANFFSVFSVPLWFIRSLQQRLEEAGPQFVALLVQVQPVLGEQFFLRLAVVAEHRLHHVEIRQIVVLLAKS